MQNKSVIITGASRGIGRALALKFASGNWNVTAACASNAEKLGSVRSLVETYGVGYLTYVGDLSKPENVDSLFAQSYNAYGCPDLLINNAGISAVGLFQDMSFDEWTKIVDCNLTSTFLCSQHAVQQMLQKKRGKIINISSVWGCVGASCEAAYSATKGAMNAMTMSLGKELAQSNIQVNAIACGIIDTDMNSYFSSEEITDIVKGVPVNRMASPKEVADFTYRLAYAGPYLTGQVIKFDGGWV